MEKNPKPLDQIVPEWGEQRYIPAENKFMAMALERVNEMHEKHPEVANPTATVILDAGKVVSFENNGDIHPSFCPRVALGSKSGTDYDYCPDHCHSRNHSEARASRALSEKGIMAQDGEAFLGGHYWACMPCWEALKQVGVTKLNIVEDADERYKIGRHKNPKSGLLPRSLRISIAGSIEQFEPLKQSLQKVRFQVVEGADQPDVLLRLAGGIDSATDFSGLVIDAAEVADYRLVLTQLSRATESLFEKAL